MGRGKISAKFGKLKEKMKMEIRESQSGSSGSGKLVGSAAN